MAQEQRQQAVESTELIRLCESIERWRRTRAKLGPMPPELWKRAGAVAARVGTSAVAQAAGLNASRVRAQKEEATRAAVARQAAPRPPFVELSGAQVLAAAPSDRDGALVELVDGRGGKLTVRLASSAGCDVAQWVEAFRRSSV
jgi:hypothetical protein